MEEEHVVKCNLTPSKIEIPRKGYGVMLYEEILSNSSYLMVDVLGGKSIRKGEFLKQAAALAAGLQSLGYKKGDVIAIFAPNSLEWFLVCLASLLIDAIPAGINFMLTSDEVVHLLKICKPRGLFVDESATAATGVEAVNKLGEGHTIKHIISRGSHEGCLSLDAVPRGIFDPRSLQDPGRSCGREPCVILFSSGTTGPQKAVLLSHEGLVLERLLEKSEELFIPTKRKHTAVAPMCHAAGFLEMTHYTMFPGDLFFFTSFDFPEILKVMHREKIETMIVVPPVAVMLCKHPLVDQYKIELKTLMVGAAPLGKELEDQLLEKFPGLEIRQIYGMTETSATVCCVPRNKPRKPGSVGRPVLNSEMKIIDIESGKNLGPGKQGEICIRSPLVMIGYVNNPTATKETLDSKGWIHTGDIGYFDEDGYFFVTDRLKELIKYKGYQVAPAELESVLLSHPDISEAAVVGVKDDLAGELPLAVVVLKEGASITAQKISDYVNGKVASHKKLRGGVRIVPYIPRTPSGKILRREIKASLLASKL